MRLIANDILKELTRIGFRLGNVEIRASHACDLELSVESLLRRISSLVGYAEKGEYAKLKNPIKVKGTEDYNILKEGMKVLWGDGNGVILGFCSDTVRGNCGLSFGVKWEDGREMWGYTGADIKSGDMKIVDWENIT